MRLTTAQWARLLGAPVTIRSTSEVVEGRLDAVGLEHVELSGFVWRAGRAGTRIRLRHRVRRADVVNVWRVDDAGWHKVRGRAA